MARALAYCRIGLKPWQWAKLSALLRLKIVAGSGFSPRLQSDSKDFHKNGFSLSAFLSAAVA